MDIAPGIHAGDRPDDLLTVQEVAELLRVPAATLRYWRYCHTGPVGFKIGRYVRYERSEVQSWLHQQCAADPAGGAR